MAGARGIALYERRALSLQLQLSSIDGHEPLSFSQLEEKKQMCRLSIAQSILTYKK